MSYLLEHPNRHAAAAGYDGFWGHPTRLGTPVRLVVIHTSESAFDQVGPDTGAEAVANYLAGVDRHASYHRVLDADSTVELLPFDHVAFGAAGHNRNAIHIAVAGVAAGWTNLAPSYRDRVIDRLAESAADALAWADLPAVRVVGSHARTDGAGLCGHVDLDPDRRTDPGRHFPWGQLLDLLEETDMPLTADDIQTIAKATAERVWGHPLTDRAPGRTGTEKAGTQLGEARRWAHMAMSLSADTDTTVDVPALADALADRLTTTDARALADELARRLAG